MRALANTIVLGFVVLVFLIGFAAYNNSKEMETFQAACIAKGGDAIFRYREDPLCLPKGAIIPIN